MSATSLLGGVLLPHWRTAGLTVLLAAVAAASGVGLIAVSGWLLTGAAITTAASSFNLFAPSALVRGLSLVRILSRYGEKVVGHDLALRLVGDVRDRLFRRLAHSVPTVGGSRRLGDVVSRVLADAEALDAMFVGTAGPVAAALGVGAALATALLAVAPMAGAVYLVAYALAASGVPILLLLCLGGSARDLLAARAELRALVLDAATGHADLTLFGRRDIAEAEFEAAAGEIARIERRRGTISAMALGSVASLGGGTALSVFVLISGRLDGPAAVGLTLAAMASFEVAATLVRAADRVGLSIAAATRIAAPVTGSPRAAARQATAALPEGLDVAIDGVWFCRDLDRPVFGGADLHCPAGSRTAIVGESGCGKSTLFDLILGLVEPREGSVRIAGAPVGSVDPRSLHARVVLMAQGTPVFLGTIRENLRLGRRDADDAACWTALRSARLASVVETMPDGLDTWCGEGGRTLSTGQARRLCLARTLLTEAQILLLDEPTAGLDGEEERRLLADLPEATAGRTVLIATHAVPPAGCVDLVARIAHGRIVMASPEDAS